ncbi:hypothetical protein ACFL0Q_06910, partial [Thermodesulfobacteriota bacterium]
TGDTLLIGEKLVGRLSKDVDPSLPVNSPWGYDSQFFWAMSQDPFMLRPQVVASLDSPSYRYQRILFPFMVWLTPGPVECLPYRLVGVNAIGWIIGFWAVIQLGDLIGVSRLSAGLFYGTNAGILFSLFHPMADLWATSWCLVGLVSWLRGHKRWACAFWMCATLTKETSALVPASVVLFHLLQGKWRLKDNVFEVLAVTPLVIWQIIIRLHLGVWPFEQSHNNLDYPFASIAKVLLRSLGNGDLAPSAGSAFLLGAFCFLAIVKIRAPRAILQTLVFVHALLLSFCGVAVMEAVRSSCRASILFVVFFSLLLLKEARTGHRAGCLASPHDGASSSGGASHGEAPLYQLS